LTEQRYRAVRESADGAPVTEVALRYGVSRQAVYSWKRRYEAEGMAGLAERSRRPHRSPSRLDAEVEALVCELRRAHPRWGARRLSYELGLRAVDPVPSRVTVHRALVRNGLVRPQDQRHKRKYRRWQREAPMQLWQLDLVGGVFLVGGRECKMLTGIDDHSRFVVIATVVAVPSGRAVCERFLAGLRRYGIPSEVLTDNGKQFTGRFTKPRPAEVLFEKTCREHGITARLTKPRSPTTTGKIERWHQTLRRDLLDQTGVFPDLPAAQAAIDAWVHTYNHERPHQSLDMATPASRFRPSRPDTTVIDTTVIAEQTLRPAPVLPPAAAQPAAAQPAAARPPLGGPAGADADAVEFDTVVAGSGQLSVLPRVQRIRMGQALAGRLVRVWVDQRSVHLLYQGQLVKTLKLREMVDTRAC
jgi:transposase InsO family protein